MSLTLTQTAYDRLILEHVPDGIRTDYSGRGMSGTTCVGYTGGDPSEFEFDLAVEIALAELDLDRSYLTVEDLRDYVTMLASSRREDSMGLGSIIYWTRLEVAEDFVPAEDDDY